MNQREFELEDALVQAYHTIQFLHGCLTDKHYKYEYPDQTLDRLKVIEKLVELPPMCEHSFYQEGCKACAIQMQRRLLRGSYRAGDNIK